MSAMDMNGMNFTGTGALMSMEETINLRKKKGQCLTCGRQTHMKKMFKFTPITIEGEVLDGRCLRCKPLDTSVVRQQQQMNKANNSTVQLSLNAPNATATSAPTPQLKLVSQHLMHLNRMGRAVSNANHHGGASVSSQPHDDQYSTRSARNNSDARSVASHGSRTKLRSERSPPSKSNLQRVSSSRISEDHNNGNNNSTNTLSPPSSDRHYRHANTDPYRRAGSRRNERFENDSHGGEPHQRRPPSEDGRSSHDGGEPSSYYYNHNSGPGSYQQQDNYNSHSGRSIGRTSSHGAYNDGYNNEREYYEHHQHPPPPPEYDDSVRRRSTGVAAMMKGGGGSGGNVTQPQASPRRSSGGPRYEDQEGAIHYERRNRGFLDRGGEIYSGSSVYSPPSRRSYNDHSGNSVHSGNHLAVSSPQHHYQNEGNSVTSPQRLSSRQQQQQESKRSITSDGSVASHRSQRGSEDLNSSSNSVSLRRMTAPTILASSNSMRRPTAAQDAATEAALQRLSHMNSSANIDMMEVVALLEETPHAPLVQIEGCKRLAQCHSLPNASELFQQAACPVILERMRQFAHHATVQEVACHVLEQFSTRQGEHMALCQFGGVPAITQAMLAFPEQRHLQKHGVAALANMSVSELLQRDLEQSVPAIVKAMTANSLDPWLQEVACLCLANLSSRDSSLKDVISASGGVDAICIAMVMHPTAAVLQEVGCRALRFLSASNEENKVKIELSGGIDAVISAMQVHRSEVSVQKEGLWALANLAINKNNKAVIGESNGIDVIVRAMWGHADDPEVQELACRTLWTLSVDPHNKALVAQLGGITAIVHAMQGHADHASVQEKGCGCLANLAANSDENKRLIVQGEGVDAVVMAMVLHSEERVVQERAVNCVRKLAFEPHLDALRAAGVAALVELAAQKFPSNCREKAQQVMGML